MTQATTIMELGLLLVLISMAFAIVYKFYWRKLFPYKPNKDAASVERFERGPEMPPQSVTTPEGTFQNMAVEKIAYTITGQPILKWSLSAEGPNGTYITKSVSADPNEIDIDRKRFTGHTVTGQDVPIIIDPDRKNNLRADLDDIQTKFKIFKAKSREKIEELEASDTIRLENLAALIARTNKALHPTDSGYGSWQQGQYQGQPMQQQGSQ